MSILLVLLLALSSFASARSMTRTMTRRMDLNMKVSIRNAKYEDINPIAELCSYTFDGPFEGWTQILAKKKSYDEYQGEISKRYEMVRNGYKHCMLVASDDDIADEKGFSGFLELGLLPSPKPVTYTWEGVETSGYLDVPYFGNVAIASNARRRGLASKLIKVGCKVVEKWGVYDSVFVAVDCENTAAIKMYEKLGFSLELDERDSMYAKKNSRKRLYLSKKLEKPEAAKEAVTENVTGNASTIGGIVEGKDNGENP